jgi:hypothetical protein
MKLALAEHRGHPATPARSEPIAAARIGWVKYGVSALVALVPIAAALATGVWPLAALAVPAFYAVEAQWVFAFPLALDGAPRPLRTARTFTRRAGGTLAVMRVVMPIAASMVFGGLAGRNSYAAVPAASRSCCSTKPSARRRSCRRDARRARAHGSHFATTVRPRRAQVGR